MSPESKKRSLEAKSRGDDAFRRKDYLVAVDAYTQVTKMEVFPLRPSTILNSEIGLFNCTWDQTVILHAQSAVSLAARDLLWYELHSGYRVGPKWCDSALKQKPLLAASRASWACSGGCESMPGIETRLGESLLQGRCGPSSVAGNWELTHYWFVFRRWLIHLLFVVWSWQRFEEAANAFYEGVQLEPENKELVSAFRLEAFPSL